MATITKDLGIATAYGYAVAGGYTGTEEEFTTLMASYATVADEAAASATAAAASATEAAGYAEDAEAQVTSATAQAEAAAASATEASGYAGNASDSADEASTYASNASASATSAASYASLALSYKDAASTYADNASTSATAAASSASDASDSADEAADSATAAATSATNAATSAAEALAAATVLADAYDSTADYEVGQRCMYGGLLYKCNTAISGGEAWDSSHWTACNVYEYDDLLGVIKITDSSTTMADINTILTAVNSEGDHVVFDVAGLGAGMYLCTIYLNAGYYRIADLVTGFEGTGFYVATDTLYDVISSGSSSSGDHYTVCWDQSSATCSRLNAAASITTTTTNFGHFGSVNSSYDNPFDDIYPWSGRKLCNIDLDSYMALTSSDSIEDCITYYEDDAGFDYDDQYGVWVYTPAFFGRSYIIGNYRYFDVTDQNEQNNIYYPAMITGRWHGCEVTLTIDGSSKTCFLPTTGINASNSALSTYHTEAKNYGGSLTDIYCVDASYLLMVVEYANLNSQTAIGDGVSMLYRQSSDLIKVASTGTTVQIEYSSAIAGYVIAGAIFDIGTSNGAKDVGRYYVVSATQNSSDSTLMDVVLNDSVTVTTAYYWSIHGLINVDDSDIGSMSGYIGTNGNCNAYYRGEVLWGNKWQYTLGVYRQTGTGSIYICGPDYDPDDYDALNTSVHTDTGLVLPTSVSAWINTLGTCNGLSIPPFCTAIGGSSTAPVGDFLYTPASSAGKTVLLLGGGAGNSSPAGAFFGAWNRTAGTSAWDASARPHLKNPS